MNEGSDVCCSTSGVCNRPRRNMLPMDPNKERICVEFNTPQWRKIINLFTFTKDC
jgi:hypothetical protein